MAAEEDPSDVHSQREGVTAKAIEEQTAKRPSDTFFVDGTRRDGNVGRATDHQGNHPLSPPLHVAVLYVRPVAPAHV